MEKRVTAIRYYCRIVVLLKLTYTGRAEGWLDLPVSYSVGWLAKNN